VVTAEELTIDLPARRVTRAGEDVHLTPIEFDILRAIASQAGRTLTHQQIFDAVWGKAVGNAQQYLRVHITNLRRKIERDPATPRLVVTEPGVGYRFELPR
jgi:two-component system KDP operon response regulator KdpE